MQQQELRALAQARRLAIAGSVASIPVWAVLFPKMADLRPPSARSGMLVATLGWLVVFEVMLWLIYAGFPVGYRPRTTVWVLGGLALAQLVALVIGVFVDDPRNLLAIAYTASIFVWAGAWWRYLWNGEDGRRRRSAKGKGRREASR